MNSKRIKEIQAETAYPQSRSVQQALLKVWNECEQEQNKNLYNEDDLEQAHFEGKLKKQSFKEWFEQFKNK